MDDFACETGGLEEIVDGAGDVERRRTDFGGRALDETVHLFERDAIRGEDEGGSDGVDADIGSPVDGGGKRRVTKGFFGERIGSGLRIGEVDAVIENIDDISFFAIIVETSHQFKRNHKIDSHCILDSGRRSVRQWDSGIDGGVVDEDIRRRFLKLFEEFRGGVRKGEIRLEDFVDGRIREGGDERLRLFDGRVAMDENGVAFLREIAGDGCADTLG